MKVKTILVSQPEPKVENSPYFELEEKQKVKVEVSIFGRPTPIELDFFQVEIDSTNSFLYPDS